MVKNDNQFVSGSNGNIEISSSKFHVKNNGDVIMNNITASNVNVSGKMTLQVVKLVVSQLEQTYPTHGGSDALRLKGVVDRLQHQKKITGDLTANTITANTAVQW